MFSRFAASNNFANFAASFRANSCALNQKYNYKHPKTNENDCKANVSPAGLTLFAEAEFGNTRRGVESVYCCCPDKQKSGTFQGLDKEQFASAYMCVKSDNHIWRGALFLFITLRFTRAMFAMKSDNSPRFLYIYPSTIGE